MSRWKSLVLGTAALVVAACVEPPSRTSSVEGRTAALLWGGEQKLVASDAAELDQFGWSVSLTDDPAGDRALVGAYGESSTRGAAYVFVKKDEGWVEEQKLAASDGADLDRYGSSVSLGAGRILVGAYGANAFRGAAYVFVKNGDAWVEEQKLVASDGAAGENFGYAVSLAGDRALVGAYGVGAARGAAYVFVRSGEAWVEEQKLVARDGAAEDILGWSVSLACDRALLGAPGADGARGAAYVFVRSGDVWTEEQELVADDGIALDNFGQAVSLAGDRALVGAHWNDDFRGAAYVFVRSGGDWFAEQKLVAVDSRAGRFGNAVSLSGDRALIGAYAQDDGRGAAHLFVRGPDGGRAWVERQKLFPGDGQADLFGWSVSLAGDHALAGAMYSDQLRGAAYHYAVGAADRDGGAADADIEDAQPKRQDEQDGGSIEAGTGGPDPCVRGEECASRHCEDGICCDRTCAANERCRADLKVSGADGTCGPAKGAALGAPCKFDVQCTSGRCSAEDGVCRDPDPAADAGCAPGDRCGSGAEGILPDDGGGCGCRAGGSPGGGRADWVGVAFVLSILGPSRRRARGGGPVVGPRRDIAFGLIVAGLALGGCGEGQSFAGVGGHAGENGGAPPPSDNPLLPAGIRRLTNAEYAASLFTLLGVEAEAAAATFPRDATQNLGFTVNDAQIVSSVLAGQLDAAAQSIVISARQSGNLDLLAPCGDPSHEGETCARAFIQSFGSRAYRRPLTADDVEPLAGLYRAVTGEGGSYEEGIDFVTRAILQAPSFLYLTELGDSTAGAPMGQTRLTPYEVASLLSYLATAAPPDRALLDDLGAMMTADGREQHLRRLLPGLGGRTRLVRVVREWLGIDGAREIDKDSNVYPAFADGRNAMAAETASFIDEVLSNGTGTLQELLGAEWTIIATENGATAEEIGAYYAGTYGLDSGGTTRRSLDDALGGRRVGILNQGAFLSRFSTATGSNPVQRGVAVMRRVACIELPGPGELDVDVIPPLPDPNVPKTTRDLYAGHAADRLCRTCHQHIDHFGFAFEQYDGMGAFRPNRQEAVKTAAGPVMLPVDTAVTLAGTGTDLDGDYADSNALARALAGSVAVRACMARQLFRASTGRSDPSLRATENRFLSQWHQLSPDRQGNLIETLVALVRSDLFVERSTGP